MKLLKLKTLESRIQNDWELLSSTPYVAVNPKIKGVTGCGRYGSEIIIVNPNPERLKNIRLAKKGLDRRYDESIAVKNFLTR